jgi:large subunit ribosomal protein L33
MRDIISLACENCKRRNYTTTRNKKIAKDKLEVKKFCPFCRGHKNHKEGKA